MKRFLLIYTSNPEYMAQMANATDEQKQEGMKPWLAWQQEMGEALVDFGAPMMGAEVSDPNGEFHKEMSSNTGYSVIQAEDMDAAKELLKTHPHNNQEDHTIQVYELISM